jgi:2,5-diamino-6-(ribosylamino)-4(3H)-pyrimidinone 5'-phosphate reductase
MLTALGFLEQALPTNLRKDGDGFWTTLTFAQSLDGKVAGAHGGQLILSGKESMIMTHWQALYLNMITI